MQAAAGPAAAVRAKADGRSPSFPEQCPGDDCSVLKVQGRHVISALLSRIGRAASGVAQECKRLGAAMNTCTVHTKDMDNSALLRQSRAKVVDRPRGRRAKSTPSVAAPVTVEQWGETWLNRREREGVRAIRDDRARWRVHIASWFTGPLSMVTFAQTREWFSALHEKGSSNPTHHAQRRARLLAALTIRNILQLARRAFEDAKREGLIEVNPFDGLEVRKSRHARMREVWTVLRPSEQTLAIGVVSDAPERWMTEVALYTGLRQGEIRALRLDAIDLDAATVRVRFGNVDLEKPKPSELFEFLDGAYFFPTKGSRPRTIPLLPQAVAALREWLKRLPSFGPNPHALAFPSADGRPRRKGRPFRAWDRVSDAVGRHVRWQDLRHTCATALLAGWWRTPLAKEEVQFLMGHSTIQVTERYVHFLDDFLTTRGVNMVDATNGKAVEAASQGEEPEGHLSSAVEQRFRNTEAGPAAGASKSDGAASVAPGGHAADGGGEPASRSDAKGAAADEPPSRGYVAPGFRVHAPAEGFAAPDAMPSGMAVARTIATLTRERDQALASVDALKIMLAEERAANAPSRRDRHGDGPDGVCVSRGHEGAHSDAHVSFAENPSSRNRRAIDEVCQAANDWVRWRESMGGATSSGWEAQLMTAVRAWRFDAPANPSPGRRGSLAITFATVDETEAAGDLLQCALKYAEEYFDAAREAGLRTGSTDAGGEEHGKTSETSDEKPESGSACVEEDPHGEPRASMGDAAVVRDASLRERHGKTCGVGEGRAVASREPLRVGDRVRLRGDVSERPRVGLVRDVSTEDGLSRALVEWSPGQATDAPVDAFAIVSEADASAYGAGEPIEIERARLRLAVGLLTDIDRMSRQIAAFLDVEARR